MRKHIALFGCALVACSSSTSNPHIVIHENTGGAGGDGSSSSVASASASSGVGGKDAGEDASTVKQCIPTPDAGEVSAFCSPAAMCDLQSECLKGLICFAGLCDDHGCLRGGCVIPPDGGF